MKTTKPRNFHLVIYHFSNCMNEKIFKLKQKDNTVKTDTYYFNSTTTLLLLLFLLLNFNGCSGKHEETKSREVTAGVTEEKPVNYNITILLDLSDRISAKKNPGQASRDTASIMEIIQRLKAHLAARGTINAEDKIKVVFYPNNYNSLVQRIAGDLNIDFGTMTPPQKRRVYESLDSIYRQNLANLYSVASSAPIFDGADLFNYFKHRAEDDCIETDPKYLNLLVIFSDGYMYHKNSMYSTGNRYSYIVPEAPHLKIFRREYNWQEKFDAGDYGFINTGSNLKNLNILALEFAPWGSHPNDYDIMHKYWSKWFTEMGVLEHRYKILKTDVPSLNKQSIGKFFNAVMM